MNILEKISRDFVKPLILYRPPSQEDESRNNKYRFLYEHASNLYSEEVQRFKDLEDKSAKLLTFLTIISILYFSTVKWASEMIGDCQIVLTIFICVVIIDVAFFFRAWISLKKALMVTYVPKLPLDEPLHALFMQDNVHINSIYYNLFQGYKKAIDGYKKVNLKKSEKIEDGYKHLDYGFKGFMLILSFPVFFQIFN